MTTAELKKEIIRTIGPIHPTAARVLVGQYRAEFANGVAYRLMHDRQSGGEDGDYTRSTRDYLTEKLGGMAFTVLFKLYLQDRNTIDVWDALTRITTEQPQDPNLETFDPRQYFLVSRQRKRRVIK